MRDIWTLISELASHSRMKAMAEFLYKANDDEIVLLLNHLSKNGVHISYIAATRAAVAKLLLEEYNLRLSRNRDKKINEILNK